MHRVRRILRIHRLAHDLGVYDGNIVGMAGEIIAEEMYGMIKAKHQNPGFDGHIVVAGELETLQVKCMTTARLRKNEGKVTFKVEKWPEPKHLLVLAVFARRTHFEEIYFGPTANVGNCVPNSMGARRAIRVEELFVGRTTAFQALLQLCNGDN